VGPIAIVFGALLIVLGIGGTLATMTSWTAMIPAILGLLLVVCGLLARQDKLRMHVMHAAALIGLIGLLGGGVRATMTLLGDKAINGIALGVNIGMAVLCAVFLVLCVRSFIDARRRRQQAAP